MRFLGSILLVLAVAWLALALLVGVFQSRYVFFPDTPSRRIVLTPDEAGLDYEAVTLTSDDGVRLDAWYIPARAARMTVLFCHGNAGNISHRMDTLETLHALGLNTLIFDYRGYGRSEGTASEAGSYRDAHAAWQWLTRERHVAPGQIILFGRSLGGAVAAELATRVAARALILESTFTSVPDLAAAQYPFLPVRWLSRIRFDTAARLPRITMPLLVIHSRDDELIPVAHGRALLAAANEPKRFLEIRGAHNDGFVRSAARYRAGLQAFLASL